MKDTYTIRQAAEELGITRGYIRQWIASGEIETLQVPGPTPAGFYHMLTAATLETIRIRLDGCSDKNKARRVSCQA